MVSCARPPSGVTSRKVRPSSLSKPAPRPAGTDEVTDHVLHADALLKEMRAGPALCARPALERTGSLCSPQDSGWSGGLGRKSGGTSCANGLSIGKAALI